MQEEAFKTSDNPTDVPAQPPCRTWTRTVRPPCQKLGVSLLKTRGDVSNDRT